MEFIDLKAQQELIRTKIEQRIKNVLDHGKYIMGPEVEELEERLANYVGVDYCIAVSSGTDGLLIAMMALGIGQGDEVITTPFTFMATAETISLLGAIPVFVDIDPNTYNIDPGKIEEAITSRTKAIMPVSLYGQCADFDTINEIASRYDLSVIEDAAQSFGATYKGRHSCGLSTIGVTSFFPSKPLGCYGDAGACFTDDGELAKRMREIRIHGQDRRYHHSVIGINGRMDTLQAAVLLEKLAIFPEEVASRQENGDYYNQLLADEAHQLKLPFIEWDNTSVYAQYTIAVNDRDAVANQLKQSGVPSAIHYPMPLQQQKALNYLPYPSDSFPVAGEASQKVLSLPMHPYLTKKDINHVVSALKLVHKDMEA